MTAKNKTIYGRLNLLTVYCMLRM